MSAAAERTMPFNRPPEDLHALRSVMYQAVRSRGASRQDADDAVQDAAIKIFSSADARAKLPFWREHRGYFITICLRCWLSRMRSEQSRRRREARFSAEFAAPEDPLIRLAERMRRARLTARQREYVTYVYLEGIGPAEIALRVGVSDRAVRKVLAAAYKKLRQAPES